MEQFLDLLTRAVLAGASEVLTVRRAGLAEAHYKDAKELVTEADQRSDAAMRRLFEEELPSIQDPANPVELHLEESGISQTGSGVRIGADPVDGTSHFAAGGTAYAVQAHYVTGGIPQIGVVFQPELSLPLSEQPNCVGRLAYAIRGNGAFQRRTEFTGASFQLSEPRRVFRQTLPPTKTWVACVPLSTKMKGDEWQHARRVLESGIVSVTTGLGSAGANVMLAIFGGQHVYANFGAGEDLDLIPPQVIAEEAGLTVWDLHRKSPVWHVRKQPFVVAQTPEMAEHFLKAAGF
jgi:3'-phosphoadenosine 5'-phosphosulfate (PAPS) 3'-phosphatase